MGLCLVDHGGAGGEGYYSEVEVWVVHEGGSVCVWDAFSARKLCDFNYFDQLSSQFQQKIG